VRLTRDEQEMLAGTRGEAQRRSMEALVQLGEAFGAEDMVEIGYAHVHPGMALYSQDVELMEDICTENNQAGIAGGYKLNTEQK